MTEETYSKEITCPNCGSKTFHEISKGIRIREYRRVTKCKMCGCKLGGFC